MDKKPIIGIVSKNSTDEEFYNWSWQIISDSLRYALCKNGAMVIGIMPQKGNQDFNDVDEHDERIMSEEEIEMLNSTLRFCDGIILEGGITSHNYEEYIAKYCFENDIPCLGICAGFNNIVRALGGTTLLLENTDRHDRPDLEYAHKCKVFNKDSIFYNCVKCDELQVNSIHTYIADKVPESLTVVARSDDGQVEVVEAKAKRFFMGIKYHPEILIDVDEKQNRIFEKFIKSCKT